MPNSEPTCPECGSSDWTISGYSTSGPLTYRWSIRCKQPTGQIDWKGKPVLCNTGWGIEGKMKWSLEAVDRPWVPVP